MLYFHNQRITDYFTVEGFEIDEINNPIVDNDDVNDPETLLAYLNQGQEQYSKLNVEQKHVVDTILNLPQLSGNVRNVNNKNCFFICGPGGTGKTFIYNTLYNLLSGNNKKVCTMAFTGIAATLLPKGKTVHKTFDFKVPLYSDSVSGFSLQSKEADYLRSVDVFIMDEAPMAPRYALEAIDRSLQAFMKNNLPFGGKIMILGGDFRQLLPVEKDVTESEIIDLCIKNSSLWKFFEIFNLKTNMRALQSEKEFSKFLLDVGDGKLNDNQNNLDLNHFPPECIVRNNSDIAREVYGDIIAKKQYKEFVNLAILSPRNEDVNEINEKVVDLLDASTEKIYTSIDSVNNCDNGALSESLLPEYLNTLNPSSLPPHSLRLRLYSVIILLRNLNIEEGLCNGTRLMVLKMSDNVLCCEILTGDKAGQMAFISRISLISERDFPFKFQRRQFPVKLAFAMTINKAQGQTFKNIAIDLTRNVFTHGQLYVALSRVRSWKNFKIFLDPSKIVNSIKNYVFKQILI